MLYSIEPITHLVLKCDGMMKNKNVPKLVADILLSKYPEGVIISLSKKYQYKLKDWVLCIVVKYCYKYCYKYCLKYCYKYT